MPPVAEIAASIALLWAAVVVVVWATSKIYRVGILMRGKRPTIREMARWVRSG